MSSAPHVLPKLCCRSFWHVCAEEKHVYVCVQTHQTDRARIHCIADAKHIFEILLRVRAIRRVDRGGEEMI